MLDLSGLTPTASLDSGAARLRWQVDGEVVETDFARFRPVGFTIDTSDDLRLTWRDFGDMPLTDPFYKFSMDAAAKLPRLSDTFETSWDIAEAVAGEPGLLPFNGAIFHMARAGSTLVHRLLGCTGKVHSLSEIGVFDRMLKVGSAWHEDACSDSLRTLMATFRRPRRLEERHFITKMTDAGGSVGLPLFRAAFPQVPWIFVYRDPVEVMVSAVAKPTRTTTAWYKNRVQVSQSLRMPAVRDPGMWPVEFVARVLRRLCRSAVDAARATPNGLFLAVDYKRLPEAVWETIAPHFGLTLTDGDIAKMRAEARYSSKRSEQTEFSPDSDRKHEEATVGMRRFAERFVAPEIEELRRLPQA